MRNWKRRVNLTRLGITMTVPAKLCAFVESVGRQLVMNTIVAAKMRCTTDGRQTEPTTAVDTAWSWANAASAADPAATNAAPKLGTPSLARLLSMTDRPRPLATRRDE